MFDYLRNEYNPDPLLVVGEPGPVAGLVRTVPYSTAIVVDVPADRDALRARQPARYWAEIRRRERRFTEDHGPLVGRVLTARADLEVALPQVQQLYRDRWDGEHTSLAWKRPEGFAPYADAMIALAGQGRARLHVLEGAGRMLSFGYCLVDDGWCHFYQHAVTPQEELRRYGLGRRLLVDVLEHLVDEGTIAHLDLMLGDAAYKREWESWRRPVAVRLVEPPTVVGRARLHTRDAYHRARVHAQFGSPALRRTLKSLLATTERVRGTAP